MTEPNPLRVLQLIDQAEQLAVNLDTTAAAVIDGLGLAGLTLVAADEQRDGILPGTDPAAAAAGYADTLATIGVDVTAAEIHAALFEYRLRLGEPATMDEADARTAAWLSTAA